MPWWDDFLPDWVPGQGGGESQGSAAPTGPTMAEAGIKTPEEEEADRAESEATQMDAAERRAEIARLEAAAEQARAAAENSRAQAAQAGQAAARDDLTASEKIRAERDARLQAEEARRLNDIAIQAQKNADALAAQRQQQEFDLQQDTAKGERDDARAREAGERAERSDIRADTRAMTAEENEQARFRERLGFDAEGRLITQQENALDRGQRQAESQARREESQQAFGLDVRGQELRQLEAQDKFVFDELHAKVESGQLSLDKATRQYEAYLERARLPTQIMQATSEAIAPLVQYMTSAPAGSSPMGFEKGGPMEFLVDYAGGEGSYKPEQYAIRKTPVDIMALARAAGARFEESGKVPDPGEAFKGVKIPEVNVGQSATRNLSPPPAMLGPASGPAPSAVTSSPPPVAEPAPAAPVQAPAPDQGGIAEGMTGDPLAGAVQPNPDEEAQLRAFIDSLAA